ncbi:MAG: efflux RND transporter permease subunit [Patescibacteria group bacterium]
MLSFWTFFLKKRQFTVLLMVALLGAGTYALFSIPKESAPEVRIPVGIVSAVFPGASAEDIETLVTDKIEDGVANIENLSKLTSTSREGVSVVTVEFDANADLDASIQDLKDAVDKVKPELPREVEDPVVSEINFADQPILIISITGEYEPAALTRLGDELKSELQAVSGVSRVEVSGVRDRAVQIVVKKAKLAQYGASLSDIVAAVQASNASLPVGSITVDGVQYALQFEGDLASSEDVFDTAVPLQSGRIVYIRDLAEIVDGLEDATSISRASTGGEPSAPSLTLSVFKSSGGNVVTVADAVKERLEELKDSVLDGGNYVVSLDLGEEVNRDLRELTQVGFETMVLVVLSLLLTIGWRESLVAAASIPLSFLIAFIGLWLSGNTINFVSLFALILAIGILVDSGIVVTEAIHTRIQRYATKDEAARASLEEYAWPLIGGTMTTVAVFVPLFFISGIVGEFIASIPFTLIFVLIASIFVALGLVPFIAITFTKKELNTLEKRQEEYSHRVQTWYKEKLRGFLGNRRLENRFLWGIILAFILSLALPITGLVPSVFFPQEDIPFIYVEIEKPEGTTLAQTDLVTRQVEEKLYGYPEIESFVTTVGSGSAFSQSPGSGAKLANITILIGEAKERDKSSSEIVAELRARLRDVKGAEVRVSEPNNGPPSGAPVLVTFSGDSLEDLEAVADRAQRVLSDIPGTTDVTSSMKDNGLEFNLAIDRAKAAAYGLTPLQVAQTLRTAIHGTTATTIRGDTDIDVIVKLDLNPAYTDPSETTIVNTDAIRSLTIDSPRGPVLLGSVLSTDIRKGNAAIQHEDRKRIATVSSQITPETTAVAVTNAFTARESELNLPPGVSMKIGGETEDVERSFREMGFAFIAGLVLMLGILVLEFNSFRHTLYLLSIVPLSLIGVFFGLFITFQPLSFSSLLGVIALAGVIINHAIILLDSMHRIAETRSDLPHKEIIVEAAASRLRPIVLTTVTTVVGMIPLAGASALWGPLAFAIMFGLAFSMVLTLVLIPTLAYRWPGKWKGARNGNEHIALPPAAEAIQLPQGH